MATISTKIQLRNDDLSNWTIANPTLSQGEAALAKTENGYYKLKIGNGVDNFNDLPYFNEDQLKTNDIYANSIQQGTQVEATPYGIAGGYFVKNAANYAQSFGTHVSVDNADKYSFTWNGKESICLCVDHETGRRFLGHNMYNSKGEGTFAVNPKDGISGFYVGEQPLNKLFVDEAKLDNLSSNLCSYVEDLEKDIYGQDRNRQLLSIDNFDEIEQVISIANEELHLGYDLQTIDTFEKANQFVSVVYEALDLAYVEPNDIEGLLAQANELTKTEQLHHRFVSTIKDYIQNLDKRLKKFENFETMLLSGEYEDGSTYCFSILTSNIQ